MLVLLACRQFRANYRYDVSHRGRCGAGGGCALSVTQSAQFRYCNGIIVTLALCRRHVRSAISRSCRRCSGLYPSVFQPLPALRSLPFPRRRPSWTLRLCPRPQSSSLLPSPCQRQHSYLQPRHGQRSWWRSLHHRLNLLPCAQPCSHFKRRRNPQLSRCVQRRLWPLWPCRARRVLRP